MDYILNEILLSFEIADEIIVIKDTSKIEVVTILRVTPLVLTNQVLYKVCHHCCISKL